MAKYIKYVYIIVILSKLNDILPGLGFPTVAL